ncbi:MAG: chorismate synthase [Thermotogota bacterium]|nr:chorismate synthase [Thermotogota bacterium]MDK2865491.1 chorismate synthase [Thermotogota bacterium]
MRYIIAGDSHGPEMVGILEGLPAGLSLDLKKINEDLERRQKGYGRGERMKIEKDQARVVGGLWKGVTTGAPLVIAIANKAGNPVTDVRSIPRPGHADFSAWCRYRLPDLNVYVERASARSTAPLVALGSVAKQFLEHFGIRVYGYVLSIGPVGAQEIPECLHDLLKRRDASPVSCPDEEASKRMIEEIERARKEGETLGGALRVLATGVPAGLGGYSHPLERLDARIAAHIMAVPSVKGVFIGNEDVSIPGSRYHDEFVLEDGKLKRSSNNAGGIEGGITNGEPVRVTVYLKPIPTLARGLRSVDLRSGKGVSAPYIRSDVTVVPAAVIVAEAVLALVLLEAFLERFGSDNLDSIRRRWEQDESFPRWDDGFWKKHSG